jgi:CRISPR/Cas system-associated exonuclease Cas4 (RecB family)
VVAVSDPDLDFLLDEFTEDANEDLYSLLEDDEWVENVDDAKVSIQTVEGDSISTAPLPPDTQPDTRSTLTPTPAGVIRLFMSRVVEKLHEEREELHLTDLTVECPRKLWFTKKDRLPLREEGFESLLRMWQGKVMHEMPLTEKHELKLEYEGVKTSIDEYDPRTKTLIEKKFTDFVPKNRREMERYFSHYILQVQLEALFLIENGYEVDKAFLLFVKRGKPDDKPAINAFEVHVDLERVKKTFEDRLGVAREILSREEPPDVPERYTPYDYPCSYCSYRGRCYL